MRIAFAFSPECRAGLETARFDLGNQCQGVKGQGIDIPDEFLAQVAPLPWSHIALTGDYLWNEIDQPLERFRPIRANRFNPKSFVFP